MYAFACRSPPTNGASIKRRSPGTSGVPSRERSALRVSRCRDLAHSRDAAAALRNVGDHPLATYPGQRFLADFDVGTGDLPRTFLVASSGYYTEWIRPRWIEGRTTSNAFDPGGTKIQDVLRSWIAAKDSLERRFFTARVPVL